MAKFWVNVQRTPNGLFTADPESEAGALRTTNYFTWADVDRQSLGDSSAI
jgi:hypothetical protein